MEQHKTLKPLYILKPFSYIHEGQNYVDFACIDDKTSNYSNQLSYVRIKNIQPEFLVLKFPKLSDQAFESLINSWIRGFEGVITSIVYLQDSQFFTPFKNTYLKIISPNHFVANNVLNLLKTKATAYYSQLDINTFNEYEQLVFKHSETPFRNISCLSIDKMPVFISTKFDIPLIGPIAIDISLCNHYQSQDPDFILVRSDDLYIIDYKDISKVFVKNSSVISEAEKFTDHLKIMSYDIETYKPLNEPEWDKYKQSNKIITIGFTVFNLTDPKPLRRYAIIPRDFKVEQFHAKQKNNDQLKFKVDEYKTYKQYYIDDYSLKNDDSVYFTTNNEKDMLQIFIKFIDLVKPFCVIGFNNWGFDDPWINAKLEQYGLDEKFLNAIYPYNTIVMKDKYAQLPLFTRLSLKADGEVNTKNSQSFSWKNGFTSFYDAMYHQYKEDAKRFNEGNSKKLENMLKIYDITSPYEQNLNSLNDIQTLSKSGLTYSEMFNYWATEKETFTIAHYCLQDAWITGVFAVRKNMISDRIEMGNITHTTFQDSILKADNVRVGNTIIYYSYLEGFAIYDSPDNNSREYRLLSPYSGKVFDKRTVIGGAVKNKRNGREMDIVAVDFSSMYPSQKEGSNVDTSARVDPLIIEHPEQFGLKLIKKYYLEDMYTDRWFYMFVDSSGKLYEIEEHFAEFKTNPKAIEKIKERYKSLKTMDIPQRNFIPRLLNLYDRLKAELYPLYKNEKFVDNLIITLNGNISDISDNIMNTTKNNNQLQQKLRLLFDLILESNHEIRLPPTIKIPVYCIQSPKDKKRMPLIHYSLKEKMLSDFRAKRKVVKNTIPKNPTHKIQLDAKEKAIKVVMNSEYGQTGNDAFGWYDSDIAAAVTFASRHCIAECTTCLNTSHFYVSEEYLNNKYYNEIIEKCKKYGNPDDVRIDKITYDPFNSNYFEGSQRDDLNDIKNSIDLDNLIFHSPKYTFIDFVLPPRRITINDVYVSARNDIENQLINFGIDINDMSKYTEYSFKEIFSKLKLPEVYCLTLPPSSVVYQDTDSNYYTNEHFSSYFKNRNPETILEIMNMMISHNNLISNLIPDIIKRPPIGVGFEGAFIVARYLNKKKKYYGKKWVELMRSWIDIPRDMNYKLNDYEKSHILYVPKGYKTSYNDHGVIGGILDKNENENENEKLITTPTFYIRYDYQHLPDDYENFLLSLSGDKEKSYLAEYTTIPFKNGSYMKFDLNSIDDNLLDFVKHFGIKCTGVDLARRDQFKFVNFNHLLTFANDLKYTPDNNLNTINIVADGSDKFKLWDPIHQLLLNFAGMELMKNKNQMTSTYEKNWLNWHPFNNDTESVFYPWNQINLESILEYKKTNKIYSYRDFPLEFYAKIVKYSEKQNGLHEVINKLTTMIEDAGMEVNRALDKINNIIKKYLHVIPQNILLILGNITNIDEINFKLIPEIEKLGNSSLIREIKKFIENVNSYSYKSRLKLLVPQYGDRVEFVIINPNNTKLTITSSKGDDKFTVRKDQGYMLEQLRVLFTDDEIYDLLDYRFYFNQLATSLCNYLAIEYDPDIANFLDEQYQIDHPDLTDAEIKEQMDKRINKAIEAIKKGIVERYYPQETITTIKKKYGIVTVRNVNYDYGRIDELTNNIQPNINFNIRIENLQAMVINDPVVAWSKIKIVNEALNNEYTHSILTLRSQSNLNYSIDILNNINELIQNYETMLNELSKYIAKDNTKRVKVFMWFDKIHETKTENCYIYKLDAVSTRKLIRNKELYTYSIPESVLITGGRMSRTTKLISILNIYFSYFNIIGLTFTKDGFKIRKDKPEIIEDIKFVLKLMSQ